MNGSIVFAIDSQKWRSSLKPFQHVDVCYLPEYHVAYCRRIKGSKPILWCFDDGKDFFCYPFLKTPIVFQKLNGSREETNYFDISSVYGYSGPLSTTVDDNFLIKAWSAFDVFALNNKIIAEFTRFSLYADNSIFAHKDTKVEFNRLSAVSYLTKSIDLLFTNLGKKTRNMIRKAQKLNFKVEELELKNYLNEFRVLYDQTMLRNKANEFFLYDKQYYMDLLKLPNDELRLFCVFDNNKMVAAAIALVHKKCALYHLGASLNEFSKYGLGNLVMFEMSKALIKSGVEFLTIGGGRSRLKNDDLFRFKKNNATHIANYYIGKRIINTLAYKDIINIWESLYNKKVESNKLLFYR